MFIYRLKICKTNSNNIEGELNIKIHKIFGQFNTSPLVYRRPRFTETRTEKSKLNNKPILFLYIVVGISFPTILGYMIFFSKSG